MHPLTLLLALGFALAQTPLGPVPTRDVHALLWHPSGALFLGHHDGIVLWDTSTPQHLVRRRDWDAMNLAWDGKRLLVAGHWVYAESRDLKRFRHPKPRGLPALDLHAYAIDPKRPEVHYTLEATHGYFQSQDGGKSFRPIPSPDPAPGPLALSPSGTLYLGGQLGLWLQTETGWRRLWQGTVLALAAHPQQEGLLAWVDGQGPLWQGR